MANTVLDATTKLLPPKEAQPKTQPRQKDKSFDLVLKKARPKATAKPAHAEAKPSVRKAGRGGKPKSISAKPEVLPRPQEKPAEEAKDPQASEAATVESELEVSDEQAEQNKQPVEHAEESDQHAAIDSQPVEKTLVDQKHLPAQSVDPDGRNQQSERPKEATANVAIEDEQDNESQSLRHGPKAVSRSVSADLPKSGEQVQENASADDRPSPGDAPNDSDISNEQSTQTATVQQGAVQHASRPASLQMQSEPPPVAWGASVQKQAVHSSTQQPPVDATATESARAIPDASKAADDDQSNAIAAKASSQLETSLTQASGASAGQQPTAAVQPAAVRPAQAAAPATPPEVRFSETNHPTIVTAMRSQLLPNGGTIHIRLDPPELGALQVMVHMQDGVMTASFQTSNDEATKLLSHSLSQLKHVLESQGVSVDKLHVEQAPRDQQPGSEDGRQQQGGSDNPSARQEQQRRELLQRMWRRLANGSDPLDLVA